MNPNPVLSALLIAVSLLGCTNSSSHSMNLRLAPTAKNPGQSATTTLTSLNNDTYFDFYISGLPSGTLLPPRVLTFIHRGDCQRPGPVAFAMNDKVNTEPNAGTGGWGFYRSAPIKLSDLLAGKYSVVVRTSPEDGNIEIFCGDIAQATR